MDKNQMMMQFLMGCPAISENPLFFNFAEAEEDTNHFISISENESTVKEYIDGSALRQYTFQIISYRTLSHNPIVAARIVADENLEDMASVRAILDWIVEQDEQRTYPDFGENCIIDSMRPMSLDPNLNGINLDSDPPIAQYSIIIRITYLDMTKCIWSST